MNKVSAEIICDSLNQNITRLTTFQIRIPLIIQAELNTHRVFSRSYNSSRAIPAAKIRMSADFEPMEWLSNQPGMVGGEEIKGIKKHIAIVTWRSMTEIDKIGHRILEWCNLHKQYTNRRLASALWVDGVITATEWDNFLMLRNHPAAQPEIRELAAQIELALSISIPDYLEEGEWHLPYIDAEDIEQYPLGKLRFISAGRCARVSYGFKDTKDSEGDLRRAEKLLNSNPKHVSPVEHVAMAPFNHGGSIEIKSGNFTNWVQFRKLIESGEVQPNFD
jgi:hypothetical protein